MGSVYQHEGGGGGLVLTVRDLVVGWWGGGFLRGVLGPPEGRVDLTGGLEYPYLLRETAGNKDRVVDTVLSLFNYEL